ncbi:fatty acid alpha-hydroxylase, partial [Coemansia helicoidea]
MGLADSDKQREFSRAEVARHDNGESLWVVRGNQVFDLTQFHTDHPGGSDALMQFAGQDITEAMRDGAIHRHTTQAYRVLKDFYIGEVTADDRLAYAMADSGVDEMEEAEEEAFLDLRKPLFA